MCVCVCVCVCVYVFTYVCDYYKTNIFIALKLY